MNEKEMTYTNAIERMNALLIESEGDDFFDQESVHVEADKVLTDFLIDLNCNRLVEIYHEIPKWYA